MRDNKRKGLWVTQAVEWRDESTHCAAVASHRLHCFVLKQHEVVLWQPVGEAHSFYEEQCTCRSQQLLEISCEIMEVMMQQVCAMSCGLVMLEKQSRYRCDRCVATLLEVVLWNISTNPHDIFIAVSQMLLCLSEGVREMKTSENWQAGSKGANGFWLLLSWIQWIYLHW